MFVIGKKYQIKMVVADGSGGVEESYGCKILKIDGTLIEYTQGKGEIIVNTASSQFVGAVLQDD